MPTHEKSPYASTATAPVAVDPTPSPQQRAVNFVHAAAKRCIGCLRSGTIDCANRCPIHGATALSRELRAAPTKNNPIKRKPKCP